MLNQHQLDRDKLLKYYHETWNLTELLFSGFKESSYLYHIPYHFLRYPLIFYLGHPAVFYINKLQLAGILKQGVNAYFERMFEIGLDEMPWDIIPSEKTKWPEISEIQKYRQQKNEIVEQLILKHKAFAKNKITAKDPAYALMMAMEHERIHFETSSVLMRELPSHFFRKPEKWPKYWPLIEDHNHTKKKIDFPVNSLISVPKQTIVLGKKRDIPYYGWDNEYGSRKISLAAYAASKYLISNGEFLQFVSLNGYHEPRFWSQTGWQWKQKRGAEQPSFWIKNEKSSGEYQLRTIFDIIPMQWDWPVIVNLHEATAFTAWKSELDGETYRLPTEAEHHGLRSTEDHSLNDLMTSQNSLQQRYNTNFVFGSETPVTAHKPNENGFHDVFGNVWQWCIEPFSPLPGFKVHPYYIDFSAPCFDGLHQVLMGSSFATTGAGASVYYRNYFRPHFFQHAGFRIVKPHY